MDKSKLNFKISAIRLYQREGEKKAIYVGTIKAADLATYPAARFRIAANSPDNDENENGYQRRLQSNKVEKIKNFVLEETTRPLFPTAILVNSRIPLDFRSTSANFGNLIVSEPLYVIDGQHRVTAWRDIVNDSDLAEKWKNYEFPIVIMSGFNREEEMEQFYVINNRQTKISTDLVYTLLLAFEKNESTKGLVREKDKWIPRAVVITKSLNTSGVWKDKIGYDSDSDLVRKTRIINSKSFIQSLKPLFVGSKKIFDLDKPLVDEWIDFLNKYWKTISEVYPTLLDTPKAYTLMKTVGINAFHILLADKAYDLGLGLKQKDELLENLKETLIRAGNNDFDEDFWRSGASTTRINQGRSAGAYSSSAGHKRLATGLFMGRLVF